MNLFARLVLRDRFARFGCLAGHWVSLFSGPGWNPQWTPASLPRYEGDSLRERVAGMTLLGNEAPVTALHEARPPTGILISQFLSQVQPASKVLDETGR